jgi:hypothetical protein
MTNEEVVEFVGSAFEHIETTTPREKLQDARVRLAAWLWNKYRIAIKDTVINVKDGMPYLKVEYTSDDDKKAEAYISLAKFKERIAAQISGEDDAKVE